MAGEVFHVSDGELFEPVDDEIGSSYWLTPASILDHCCESENIHGHGQDYTTAQYRAPDTYEGLQRSIVPEALPSMAPTQSPTIAERRSATRRSIEYESDWSWYRSWHIAITSIQSSHSFSPPSASTGVRDRCRLRVRNH
jgi:hypothetical protein